MPTTYVAVDLQAIKHNVREVCSRLAEGTSLMAVVKGNAYGHGMVPVAKACVEVGVDWLGVSSVDEGLALREAGVVAPVLVFVPPLTEECQPAVAETLTVTITTEEHLAWLRESARDAGRPALAHIYVDSELGRPSAGEDLPRLIEIAAGFPQLHITGVYTHLDNTRAPTVEALDVIKPGAELHAFAAAIKALGRQHLGTELMFHAAASGLFLLRPESYLDMVRIGTLLYGQYPPIVPQHLRTLDLRNTFELRSKIVGIVQLPRGSPVGYGREFVCRRETRVATLPVGYAHGLALIPESLARRRYARWRQLLRSSAGPYALIGEHKAPIIGRIAMDQCCVDVTDLPEVQVGTEVAIPTRRVSVSSAVPRHYTGLGPE